MKTMKTFTEFKGERYLNETNSMAEGSCMSEMMEKKCNELMEAMCEEMKTCHEDETENSAATYESACKTKLNEMMKEISKACESYTK